MKAHYVLIFTIFLLSYRAVGQPPETIYLGIAAKTGYANDESYGPFNIGFNFTYFGNSYSQFYISSNGLVSFGAGTTDGSEDPIPTAGTPNNIIAAFWDDLVIDPSGHILYTTVGAAPNRKLIVQFKNMGFYTGPIYLGTFSVILYETSNKVQVQFRLIVIPSSTRAHGDNATIGLENADGTAGVQYSYHKATAITNGQAISFTPSGLTYTVDGNAIYDGIYLTTNLSLPEPGITDLINPPENGLIGTDYTYEWAAASYATSYKLYISSNSDLSGATIYDAGPNLTYDVTGLTVPATYYWGVFASNNTGTTWCEIRRFSAGNCCILLYCLPQTIWTESSQDTIINLKYIGVCPNTIIITSLPVQGQLYHYNAGVRGSLISSVPDTLTDGTMNIIYAASGYAGQGVGNFNFKLSADGGFSCEGIITINVGLCCVPPVLCIGKSETTVEINFDRPMADPAGKQNQFTIKVNGSPVTINSASLKACDPYKIVLTMATSLTGIETVQVSYTQGDVIGANGVVLLSFPDQVVSLNAQTINFPPIPVKTYGDPDFYFGAISSCGLPVRYFVSDYHILIVEPFPIFGPGTYEITAMATSSENCCPARCTQILIVSKADQTITFNPLQSKTIGDPDFSPGATASSGLPISYSSDNTEVATIVSNMIHIVGAGTANITASQPGNNNYNPAPDVMQPLTVNIQTGLENLVSQNEFNIYSSNNLINILTLADEWNGGIGSIRVISITGNILRNLQPIEFWKNSLIQVEAPASNGVYIVELKAGVLRYAVMVVVR